MLDGEYLFFVKDYTRNNNKGFRAEIAFEGQLYEFDHPTAVLRDVPVATVTLNKGKFSIERHLPTVKTSKKVWSLNTEKWHKVTTMCLSPNFWNGQAIGNKHYFFTLQGCNNPAKSRGLYSEFLAPSLHEQRRVFELLGSKLQVEPANNTLSGLGFSSTIRNDLKVKVDGRVYNIKF